MRIASTQYHETMSVALQDAGARLERVMQQMATGQRLLHPSDDPVTHVRLSRMEREESALVQYRDNIGALSARLAKNESSLSSMVQDMLQVRDLLVWAKDGGNTSEDVEAMSGSLATLRNGLFFTANVKDQEGRYLFSGTLGNQPALTRDPAAPAGSRYTFTGNNVTQQVVVGNGITQPANVSLPELADLLNQMDSVIETLQTPNVNVSDPAAQAVLNAGLDGLDAGLDSVNAKIAHLGGAQNIIATLGDNHGNVSVANQQAKIVLGQLDYGQAATELGGYTLALKATQAAYAKVSGLSLFDVI